MKTGIPFFLALGLIISASAELKWIDGRDLPLEGRAFGSVENYYDRLPAPPKGMVNARIERLRHHTAGFQFRFRTDSPRLVFKWENTDSVQAYPNLSAMGASGIDVYRRRPGGDWAYLKTGRVEGPREMELSTSWTPGDECLVYLPTYNGIKSFRLGIEEKAQMSPLPPRPNGAVKPVVFYGTSITQGASSSRPGLAYPSVVGRALDVPVVNLGFSGAGEGEPVMADFVASVDGCCYVVDCVWNMDESQMAARYANFVRTIRKKRPDAPIVLVEGCDVYHGEAPGRLIQNRNAAVRKIWRELEAEGVRNLHFLPSKGLLPDDGEATADGIHPNDWGMAHLAKAVTEAVRDALTPPSRYEVLVPVGGHRANAASLSCEFDSVKKLDSGRIVFVAGTMQRDGKKLAEIVERTRQNVADAKKAGFRETAAWFWSFWCSDAKGLTTMTASDGWTSHNICCPLDPGFRKVAGDQVRAFAGTGVDMILLDDDFRYGNYHDEEFVCTCARHMARIHERLGEQIAPKDLRTKAMTGGRNRYRDAWMDVNAEALRDYAAFLRRCVDEVNPKVRLGLCSCMSLWDNDGVDSATIARILAGSTRPFLRLISAPYWASPKGPHYYGCNLQSVIEFERMERSWVKGDDIEVVSEGDTYPRPRWTTGSSHLELFDLALRVDGRFNGILKYAVDYDEPARDLGYVARHVRNRPLQREVSRRFDGRQAVGVRVYEEMNRLREAVLDGPYAGNTKFLQTFGSEAAKCCGDLAIPTVWEGEGLVGMAFGENVRYVPAEARRRGLVIDAWAARILMAQGVDVGVKAWGKPVRTGVDVVADGLVNSYAAYDAYDVTLAETAEVVGTRAPGRPPYAFLYRNAAGEKYLVLPLEAYGTSAGWHRTYEAGRLLAEGIRKLAGKPLPAFLPGNPDVLLMAKDGADGSRSVAVFNCFSDALVDAPVELDRPFARVEFTNCRGHLEGSRVVLDEVPAYGFAAFTVHPNKEGK